MLDLVRLSLGLGLFAGSTAAATYVHRRLDREREGTLLSGLTLLLMMLNVIQLVAIVFVFTALVS